MTDDMKRFNEVMATFNAGLLDRDRAFLVQLLTFHVNVADHLMRLKRDHLKGNRDAGERIDTLITALIEAGNEVTAVLDRKRDGVN